jgi:hypothetical protein
MHSRSQFTTMALKRSLPTDQSEFHSSPQHNIKRPKTSPFNAIAIKRMGYTFNLPEVIPLLRTKTQDPWKLGSAVGVMLYHISPLLSTHLDNSIDFQNAVPVALISMPGFVSAIDQYIAYLRLTDGCTKKFPNDLDIDRKGRKPRRKYMERYTYMVEAVYKNHIREALSDIVHVWNAEQTQLFNKGLDKALSGVQWVIYPENNVILEAREGDWAVWIRGRCEVLAMAEAKAGRKVLEDM